MSQTKIDISNLSDSVIAALSVPKITTLQYPGDDTAADPAGNQLITLIGSGFNVGAQVFIDGTIVSVVSVLSSTQLTFISPAKAPGSYELRVVNTDGGLATSVNNIQYSGVPVWTTPSGSLANVYEGGSVTSTLSATSDTPVTYSLTSGTLPTGVTLTGNTVSGTTGTVIGDTTYNFTIDAIDGELQNTSRNFNIGVLADSVTWTSPANNSTVTANNASNITPVTLNATAASGSAVTYSANALPSGLTLSGNTISGTSTVVANTSVLLTATSTQSSKTSSITLNFNITSSQIAPGQVEYTAAGTYTWVAPAGVTSVSVLCVGGGGGGQVSGTNSRGGGGGGLGWKNNISVTPGQSYTVVVGAGGAGGQYLTGGGESYFIVNTLVAGRGGGAGVGSFGTGGTYVGDGGGNGGLGYGGGGGAAGYSGNGGDGGNSSTGAAGTGGGGGGGSVGNGKSGGGGVGIYGQGTSGAATSSGAGGSGGSGGTTGSEAGSGANGGVYGGGGGGFSGPGGKGAVRIIWGTGRAWPSTNTQNM